MIKMQTFSVVFLESIKTLLMRLHHSTDDIYLGACVSVRYLWWLILCIYSCELNTVLMCFGCMLSYASLNLFHINIRSSVSPAYYGHSAPKLRCS